MKTSHKLLLAASLAAVLALTGCDADGDGYDDQTGEPVGVIPTRAEPEDYPDPCPPEWGASINPDGEIDFSSPRTYGIEPGSACEALVEQQRRDFHQKFDAEFSRIVEEHDGGAS